MNTIQLKHHSNSCQLQNLKKPHFRAEFLCFESHTNQTASKNPLISFCLCAVVRVVLRFKVIPELNTEEKLKQFAAVTVFLLFAISTISTAQNIDGINVSANTPNSFEQQQKVQSQHDLSRASGLEELHKSELEIGNKEVSEQIRAELHNLGASFGIQNYPLMKDEQLIENPRLPETPQGDWLTSNPLITAGATKAASESHKQIDMKIGEDNILYAVVNGNGSGAVKGYFYLYKSTNFGRNWSYVYSVGSGLYIGSVSLLVESKSNMHPDSTRLIVFYTASATADMSSARINFYSMRVNSSGILSGTVANPASGKKIWHISPVSDGAYWQSATYFGVVYSELDNATSVSEKIGFARSIDWGVNWSSLTLSTGYNDNFPSADYKEGSADSVYIAVERRFSASHSEVRVIATPWFPSQSFNTYYLTVSPNTLYKKPCIAIKQEGFADSIMISATKNGMPVYHYTTIGGGAWLVDNAIASGNGSNKLFTHCSSSPKGSMPFSVCWLSDDGDSVNVRRGALGNLGSHTYQVNSQSSSTSTSPVCATVRAGNYNNNAVAYAGNSSGVFCSQEGLKDISVKAVLQGFYNPSLNKMNMSDTVRLYVRSSVTPFSVIDSGMAVLNSESLTADFSFSGLNEGGYYLALKHRNSIETWSTGSSFSGIGPLGWDFAAADYMAHGENQIQVDNSPVRFALYSGDVNQDGTIDATDLSLIDNSAVNFASGYVATDVTGDNFVDGTDFSIADNNAAAFVSIRRP